MTNASRNATRSGFKSRETLSTTMRTETTARSTALEYPANA